MEAPYRILFVDDDARLLGLIQSLLEDHAPGRWQIQTAQEAAAALAVLQRGPIDLVVLDIHMPLVDGLQFLRLLQKQYSEMAKVVLTGDGSGAHRKACLEAGADLFVEKPRALGGWPALFATLEQLAGLRSSESGFRGIMRQVELQDVLQMECLARSSSILTIKAGVIEGSIYIQDGSFIHAEAGDTVGEAAFNRLLSLSRGEFALHTFAEPPRRTIEGPWEFLLMEAARQRDEIAGAQPDPAPVEDSENASMPIHLPGLEILPDSLSEQSFVDFELDATAKGKPRIDEVLLTSIRANVLYEWQSSHPEKRVHLMALLQHKAAQLAETLPLGTAESLDIEAGSRRILIHLNSEYFLFVCSSRQSEKAETFTAG